MRKIAEYIFQHPYLSYPEQQLLNDIIQKIPPLYPMINKILLYGSKARGNFLEWSDVDMLFVTDYDLRRTLKFEIYDLIFELEVKYSVTVSVIFVTALDFQAGGTSFLRSVAEEGIILWSKD